MNDILYTQKDIYCLWTVIDGRWERPPTGRVTPPPRQPEQEMYAFGIECWIESCSTPRSPSAPIYLQMWDNENQKPIFYSFWQIVRGLPQINGASLLKLNVSFAEPNSVDRWKKFNCPRGGWHCRPGFGEIGKCCSFILHHPVKTKS